MTDDTNEDNFVLTEAGSAEDAPKPDIDDVLRNLAGGAAGSAAEKEAAAPAAASPPASETSRPARKKKKIYVQENTYASLEAKEQLEDLMGETGKTKKQLHADALNLLFREYGLPEVG